MEITVTGKNANMSRKEIKHALDFFGSMVLGSRLAKNVSVDVVCESMSLNFCGFCEPIDHGYRNHRFFEITLNSKQPKSMQLRTLAHETVHVMQFARNQFKILDEDNTYKWRGKVRRINFDKYFSMPWEKEAHLSEGYLLDYYKQYCRSQKK